jgi:hypothetical protein
MTRFLKILATIIFFLIWGQCQHGCQQGARSTGSGAGYALINIFGLVLLGAGIYGIWKYNSNKNEDNDNHKLDKN